MKPKRPTPQAKRLLEKLETLAARGVNGEAEAAKEKLESLKKRYDFSIKILMQADIFKGTFQQSTVAAPIMPLDPSALDVASFVKWAIETRATIPCLFRDGQLYAQATPKTAGRLSDIARTLSDSFLKLWAQYRAVPGVSPADRAVFLRGLYDGCMDEVVSNEQLPQRTGPWKPAKAKRRDVAHVAGIALHPYSIAATLGRDIRFSTPLEEVTNRLNAAIVAALPQQTQTP